MEVAALRTGWQWGNVSSHFHQPTHLQLPQHTYTYTQTSAYGHTAYRHSPAPTSNHCWPSSPPS